MSTFMSLYEVNETEYDEHDNFVSDHKTNLPHSKDIVKRFCEQWNKDADSFMLDLVNKECDNRIKSCYMRQFNPKGSKTVLCVDFIAKEGKQLTRKIKDAIMDFMSAQYSDGWGEGMFDKKITAPDGKRYSVS